LEKKVIVINWSKLPISPISAGEPMYDGAEVKKTCLLSRIQIKTWTSKAESSWTQSPNILHYHRGWNRLNTPYCLEAVLSQQAAEPEAPFSAY